MTAMREISIKRDVQKSEAWLSTVTALGALLTAYLSHVQGAATWIALGVCGALAAVYAYFRTPLASQKKPGWKTKTFWVSVTGIVGSVATAIAEIDIAGIPARVTQTSAMISAGIVALGYTIWRSRDKVGSKGG